MQWVGCQGSRPELRGYTCSLWKLFHTLTVQAALRPKALMNTGEQHLGDSLEGRDEYVQRFCYAVEKVTDKSKFLYVCTCSVNTLAEVFEALSVVPAEVRALLRQKAGKQGWQLVLASKCAK